MRCGSRLLDAFRLKWFQHRTKLPVNLREVPASETHWNKPKLHTNYTMSNYDFLNLSDVDFEILTQDLIQASQGIKLERFTAGRDGGTDLRHAKGPDNLIIQCKRYSSASSLIDALKKEVPKVRQLNPTRFIISTSVGLTPGRKEEIKRLFEPYILNTVDILGRQALNDLLSEHPDIERQHFKLWLPSTNILNKILHSKTYNQSQFEIEKVREGIELYVQNPSLEEAIEILNKENFVIISGIPGIGKTTLARMLVYHLLADGFEEFVFMSDNINDGYEYYVEDKKQVFLFDDFLGSNLLENKLQRNEEKKIIDFIEQIHKSKNKVLILTTREYVLNQAKNQFEPFEKFDWKRSKCIVDLSKYTRPIRAHILYNHIYYSHLSVKHLEDILQNNNFLKIIDHPNYNPRIIESLTVKNQWEQVPPEEFFDSFIKFLDFPESIWNYAFTVSISELSRSVLLLLASLGSPVLIEDLQRAIKSFVETSGPRRALVYNELAFKKSLKELEDTFIVIDKDSEDNLVIDFQNPSIYDFLITFLRNNPGYNEDIISSATFINQFFTIFSFNAEDEKKILLPTTCKKMAAEVIIRNFSELERSSLLRIVKGGVPRGAQSFYWARRDNSTLYKLAQIALNFEIDSEKEIEKFLVEQARSLDLGGLSSLELDSLVTFANKRNLEGDINLVQLFTNIKSNLRNLSDVENLAILKELYFDEYLENIDNDSLSGAVRDAIQTEIDAAELNEQEDLHFRVVEVQAKLDVLLTEELEEIVRGIAMYEDLENEKWDHIDPDDFGSSSSNSADGDAAIVAMFGGLRERTPRDD